MTDWKEYYIKDIAKIKSGKRLPAGHSLLNEVTAHPYIKARDIKGGIIDDNNLQYLSDQTFQKIKKYIVDENDICITIVGANVGDVGKVPKKLNKANLTENAVRLTEFSEMVSPHFLYKLISQKSYKEYMELLSGGTAQPKLGIYKVEKILVKLPPFEIQEVFSSILSQFDNLIENNHKRIKILNKICRDIYIEWFVRMRFPGYKEIKFEKGIPNGWISERVEKHIEIIRGRSYTGLEIDDNSGTMPFINLKNMNRGGGFRLNGTKFYSGKFKKDQIVKPGDIVMAVTDMTQDRSVVGRFARVPKTNFDEYVISLDIAKIVSKNLPTDFLYSTFRFNYYGQNLAEYANGTNVLHLNPELLKKEFILIPTSNIVNNFVHIVKPIYELLDIYSIQSLKLKEIRDRLLPRMISGKLQVKNSIKLSQTISA